MLRRQLEHLADLAERPIEIRILPLSAGAHAGFFGSFPAFALAGLVSDVAWSDTLAGANCVEAGAMFDGGFAVRDSKHRTGPALLFSRTAWQAFLTATKSGHFDR